MVIPLLLLSIPAFATSHSGFLTLYNLGLAQDSAYQEANLQLLQAENNLNLVNSVFEPTLGLTTPTITFNASGLVYRQVNPTVFVNFGTLNFHFVQISFSLPLNLYTFKLSAPQLNISRKLITENQAKVLQMKAAYLNAQWTVHNIRWSYLESLLQNIFDWYYYSQMVRVYSREVKTLSNMYSSVNSSNQAQRNSAYLQLLTAKSNLFNFKNSLHSLQPLPDFTPYSTKLYREAFSFASSLTSKVSTPVSLNVLVSKRTDIEAMRYQYEASKYRSDLWFFPFIPNPTISISLPLNDFSKWSISFNLNYQLLNGGSNVVQSRERMINVRISQEKLQSATTADMLALKSLFSRGETLKIALEKTQNAVQTSFQSFQTAKALYEKSLESADEYTLAKLDYVQALISEEKAMQNIFLNKVQIMQIEGLPFGGEHF